MQRPLERGWRRAAAVSLMLSLALAGLAGSARGNENEGSLPLRLRSRVETEPGSGVFRVIEKAETWNPRQSAIIVCDMWDLHHCLNATRRVEEMAPRMNQLLDAAREPRRPHHPRPEQLHGRLQGPPGPAARDQTPTREEPAQGHRPVVPAIPAEEKGKYPIDQSDGGEDDDPAEHAEWAAKLKAMGRNPAPRGSRRSTALTIHDGDVISDSGEEIWSILEQRGIDNVILVGVHTNMCVLGRPFGLRQMAKNGKNVVLMRDMTDTMYNPARSPYVSHFTGTDLIVEHIEKWVCPTITSDQVLGGKPFRFPGRQAASTSSFLIAEDEYETEPHAARLRREAPGQGVPGQPRSIANEKTATTCRASNVLEQSGRCPRQRSPPASCRRSKCRSIRKFVARAKPVVGIRTASHAFAPGDGQETRRARCPVERVRPRRPRRQLHRTITASAPRSPSQRPGRVRTTRS